MSYPRLFLSALWRHGKVAMTSGAVAAGLTLIPIIFGIVWPSWIGGVAVVLALIFASYRAWYEERAQIDSIALRQRPRLIISRPPDCHDVALDFGSGRRATVWYVTMDFANEPLDHTAAATATNVIARLAFFDASGTQLPLEAATADGELYGRWASSEQRIAFPPLAATRSLNMVTFEPNGLHHSLDLVMKFPGEAGCFASNNDHFCDHFPGYRIDEPRFFVRIRLTGDNCDLSHWVEIAVADDGHRPSARLFPTLPFS